MSMVKVTDLDVAYSGNRVVHGISFSVREGEFLTLLGPSGCGKTTTLRCIAGLEYPTAGEIQIGPQLVSAPARGIFVPPDQRQIGMVFQSYAIWPHMTVFHNVSFPLESRRMQRSEVKRRVMESLSLLRLDHLADRPATKLSGGQQQRVALARALVSNPGLLLLDEPLSNLDAKLRESTRVELKRLQRQLGITTIYVTHDQVEAMELSDRVLVLNHGRIEQEGTPREIYENPATPFVADFIGQANFVKGRLEQPAGPERWVMKTEGGAQLTVVSPTGGIGQMIALAIRPHRLVVGRYSDPVHADNVLEGQVLRSVYIGERLDCLISVSGVGEVRAHVPPDVRITDGEQVRVGFTAAHGRVLLQERG